MSPETVRSSAELIISVILGAVFGGTIIRFLVNKWLKDREEFERATHTRLESMNTALISAKDAAKDYVDNGLRAVRDEGAEARRVLREHVDHEDKILRDRWHSLDTLTQILVNNISLMREELKQVVAAQGETNDALHEIDKTLSRLATKS